MSIRSLFRRRLDRLPTTFINLGAFFTLMGKVALSVVEHREVQQRTQRRMRAEGLVRGHDDARAQVIAAEELARYRAEFQDDTVKFEVKQIEAIDPWRDFPGGTSLKKPRR